MCSTPNTMVISMKQVTAEITSAMAKALRPRLTLLCEKLELTPARRMNVPAQR